MLDVDGVLITGRPCDGRQWYAELKADLGIDPSWLRSTFFANSWNDIVEGRADLLDSLQACLDQLDEKFDAQTVMSYWFEMDSRVDLSVLEDCAHLREKGVAIYLATNQEHCRAHYLMHNIGLAAHVDGIIYSAQLGYSKPSRSFYDTAAQIAGQLPENIILVDDTLPNIVGAQQVGWHATHWTGDTRLSQILQG